MYDLNQLVKIGEGRLSTVYKLEGGKMLKVFKYPNIAQYEFRQTLAVWQAGVSKQKPHEVTDVNGNEAIVYDYLEGDVLMNRISRDRAHILRYLGMMAECQAAVGKGTSDALPSGREGLRHAITHAPHLPERMRGILLRGLDAMPDGNRVLHGDLHPMNIILCGSELNAIDWMTGSRGDPAADIARSYFILRYSVLKEDRNFIDAIGRNVLFGVLGGHYLRRVLKASGVSRCEVRRWLPYIAAGRLTEDRPKTEVREILKIVGRHCGKRA